MEKLLTKEKIKVDKPKQYKVILMNDDYTPMDFVVFILEKIFGKNRSESVELMLETHKKGRAIAGTYPLDIAQTKALSAEQMARKEGHPFKLHIEPAEG